ncbi:hypothetical protein ACJJIF_06570 [Microbulbifer sp. SSSA002]|uniref:hypothetical protein n=1 Tax=Microbulbifer sp. SSSA002 TaxID=3243376 RepID=UPI00403935C7
MLLLVWVLLVIGGICLFYVYGLNESKSIKLKGDGAFCKRMLELICLGLKSLELGCVLVLSKIKPRCAERGFIFLVTSAD